MTGPANAGPHTRKLGVRWRWAVQRQAAGKRPQLLAKHQPAAIKARLERLILEVQPKTRLLGAQSLDIAQHNGRTIDLGQLGYGPGNSLPELRPQQGFVRHP